MRGFKMINLFNSKKINVFNGKNGKIAFYNKNIEFVFLEKLMILICFKNKEQIRLDYSSKEEAQKDFNDLIEVLK
jgi:hypothetical protein